MSEFIKYEFKEKIRIFLFLILFIGLTFLFSLFLFGKTYSQIILIFIVIILSIVQLYYLWILFYQFKLDNKLLVVNHFFSHIQNIYLDELIDIRVYRVEKYNVYKFFTKTTTIKIVSTDKLLQKIIQPILSLKFDEIKIMKFKEIDSIGFNGKIKISTLRNIIILDLCSIIFGIALFFSFALLDFLNILGLVLIFIGILYCSLHIYKFLLNKEEIFIDINGISINNVIYEWKNITQLQKWNSIFWGNMIKMNLVNGKVINISSSFLYGNIILENYFLSKINK